MKNNKINYLELQALDLEKVKSFYSKTFGWQFTDYGDDYSAFSKSSSGLDGGFYKVKKIDKGGTLPVLYHNNLEEALKNVRANGATITKEIFTFPGGRRFHFQDPSENELAIWSDK